MNRYVQGIVTVVAVMVSSLSVADCRDWDAKAASDDLALSYFRQADIFHPARVLKLHHPSRHKEVASYVAVGDKRYSIFSLVDENCRARFIKRTRQGD